MAVIRRYSGSVRWRQASQSPLLMSRHEFVPGAEAPPAVEKIAGGAKIRIIE
ncbi:MAG: hypothetical protein WDN04_25985 [Rhodospirillales bacterium]